MARHMTEPVKTFSVGFRGSRQTASSTTRGYVRRALRDRTSRARALLSTTPVDLETLDLVARRAGRRSLRRSASSALSELTAEHVTVALSGQGADELLGGLPTATVQIAHASTAGRPRLSPMRRAAASALRRGPGAPRRRRQPRPPADPVVAGVAARSEWAESWPRALRAAASSTRRGLALRRDAHRDRPRRLESSGSTERSYLDAQLALVDDMLHYFDRASMAHSLEVRVPFLDHRLVEFCASIPSALKVQRRVDEAHPARGRPGSCARPRHRRPKVGFFSGAVEHWFQQQVGGSIGDVLLTRGRDTPSSSVARKWSG